MTKLYHFTSFEAACEIIESRKLRFGKMYRMNDLIESSRISCGRIIGGSLSKIELFAEDEINRYQQISFVQDKERDGVEYLGFDMHSMWGLYAEGGFGACLVFDKEKMRLEEGDYAHIVDYAHTD